MRSGSPPISSERHSLRSTVTPAVSSRSTNGPRIDEAGARTEQPTKAERRPFARRARRRAVVVRAQRGEDAERRPQLGEGVGGRIPAGRGLHVIARAEGEVVIERLDGVEKPPHRIARGRKVRVGDVQDAQPLESRRQIGEFQTPPRHLDRRRLPPGVERRADADCARCGEPPRQTGGGQRASRGSRRRPRSRRPTGPSSGSRRRSPRSARAGSRRRSPTRPRGRTPAS